MLTRQVAFLRGVSPLNTRMPALKAAFETMGYRDVRTVLTSGNVVFSSARRPGPALASAIEAGLATQLSRHYPVILRSAAQLQRLLDHDPFAGMALAPDAKRLVTLLGHAKPSNAQRVTLPITRGGAGIVALNESEALTVYAPADQGPIAMALIERTFGKGVTTRSWETIRKCASA